MKLFLAHTQDYGPIPGILFFSFVVVMISGIRAILSARRNDIHAHRRILRHLFVIVAIAAIGVFVHFMNMRYFEEMRAKSALSDIQSEALELGLMAEYDLWFACIAALGGILGVIALSLRGKAEGGG